MSEVIPIRGDQGELFTQREALEALNIDQLTNYILSQGEKASEIEGMMNLAAQVLEGYGTSVEKELEKR